MHFENNDIKQAKLKLIGWQIVTMPLSEHSETDLQALCSNTIW